MTLFINHPLYMGFFSFLPNMGLGCYNLSFQPLNFLSVYHGGILELLYVLGANHDGIFDLLRGLVD
jgi:hypothetical protein